VRARATTTWMTTSRSDRAGRVLHRSRIDAGIPF
jgi:hypothetical protein